ncbi:NAD(P)/FAD-dependent oxidoreductase [Nakamurella sp. GG22]
MTARRPTRVVMIGGGYASLHAYRALVRRIPADRLHICVVTADDCHNFHGFSAEVVAGVLPLSVTRTRLTYLLPQAEVLHGSAIRIDVDERTVLLRPVGGGADRTIRYDHLVVGAGGREPVGSVVGMAEHGFSLRAPGQFERWLERLDFVARQTAGAPAAEGLAPVVIAGGGMAGVEIAAAVAARLRTAGSATPVVLAHSGHQLLPALRAEHPAVADRAERELVRSGVIVRSQTRVTAVGPNTVTLSSGAVLAQAAVLATTGQRPVVLPGLEGLPHDRLGKLLTRRTLQVSPTVWAAGDAARVAHPGTGRPVTSNALWAIKAGGHVGRNLARVIDGRRPKSFTYRGLGEAMAFGIGRSATVLYGIPVAGPIGWLLRLSFFLRFLPERRRAGTVLARMTAAALRRRPSTTPALRQEPSAPGAVSARAILAARVT